MITSTLNKLLSDEAYLCKKKNIANKKGQWLKYVWYKRKWELVSQRIDLEMRKKNGYNNFIDNLKIK